MEMSDFTWQDRKYAGPEIYVVTYGLYHSVPDFFLWAMRLNLILEMPSSKYDHSNQWYISNICIVT